MRVATPHPLTPSPTQAGRGGIVLLDLRSLHRQEGLWLNQLPGIRFLYPRSHGLRGWAEMAHQFGFPLSPRMRAVGNG